MAVSPGGRIGVPVSTPKTPTLVMLIVPPASSAGVDLPARAFPASSVSARGQLGQAQRLGVLDVGHHQPALGGGGDAQVHVVPDHDLLGLPRPSWS